MAQNWDEDKLIKKLLSGEESQINAAASELSEWAFPMVAKIVRIGGGQDDDIQMILDDAVLEVIKKVQKGTYNSSLASLKTLLYSIAKNKWLDELDRRYRTKYHEVSTAYDYIPQKFTANTPMENQLFSKEEKEKIIRALEQLDPDCRLLFKMKYLQGISLRTIAENLGIKENTVKKRHERCKKKLRQIFGQDPRIG